MRTLTMSIRVAAECAHSFLECAVPDQCKIYMYLCSTMLRVQERLDGKVHEHMRGVHL